MPGFAVGVPDVRRPVAGPLQPAAGTEREGGSRDSILVDVAVP